MRVKHVFVPYLGHLWVCVAHSAQWCILWILCPFSKSMNTFILHNKSYRPTRRNSLKTFEFMSNWFLIFESKCYFYYICLILLKEVKDASMLALFHYDYIQHIFLYTGCHKIKPRKGPHYILLPLVPLVRSHEEILISCTFWKVSVKKRIKFIYPEKATKIW